MALAFLLEALDSEEMIKICMEEVLKNKLIPLNFMKYWVLKRMLLSNKLRKRIVKKHSRSIQIEVVILKNLNKLPSLMKFFLMIKNEIFMTSMEKRVFEMGVALRPKDLAIYSIYSEWEEAPEVGEEAHEPRKENPFLSH